MEQKSVVKLLQTKESLYVFDAAAEKDILSAEKLLRCGLPRTTENTFPRSAQRHTANMNLRAYVSPHVLTLWTLRRTSGNITPFPLIGT